jgi:hypothetical protein
MSGAHNALHRDAGQTFEPILFFGFIAFSFRPLRRFPCPARVSLIR